MKTQWVRQEDPMDQFNGRTDGEAWRNDKRDPCMADALRKSLKTAKGKRDV